MAYIESLSIGVGLSMDAMAAAMSLGAAGQKSFHWRRVLLTAFMFGFFQGFMPFVGWIGCSLLGAYIQFLGKITASLLLVFVGVQMIREGVAKKKKEEENERFSFFNLIALAFATSIDALLVGVSYACRGYTDILLDVIMIGLVTAFISFFSCIIGRTFGNRLGTRCTTFGGIVLILVALKIVFTN